MNAKVRWFRMVTIGLLATLVLGFSACGTIMYPERRGQGSGKLDAGVVIMDGIALLVFFIPGVIAFAVDFSTGAIYLPSGRSSLDMDTDKLAQVIMPAKGLSMDGVARIIESRSGRDFDLQSAEVMVFGVDAENREAALLALARGDSDIERIGTRLSAGEAEAVLASYSR